MNAKISTRIMKKGRTKLENVIPLKYPLTIFVDPASVCNFQCEFCANGNRELIKKTGRYQGLLDFNVYKNLIDEVSEYEVKTKVLRLYKEGEPLLHPQFSDMIRYAKNKNCFESIDTTTNGSLLTHKKSLEIIDAGIDRINISVEAMSDEKYKKIVKAKFNFEDFVKNIKFLYNNKKDCTIFIKIIGNYLTDNEKDKFFETFGDICDLIAIENLSPCWNGYDMSEFEDQFKTGIYGQKINPVQVCPYVFYNIVVNSDGTVSGCFLDWEHKLIVGDLKKDKLKDIWNNNEMQNLRKLHLLKKGSDVDLCKNCGQLIFCEPDDIDAYADILLTKCGLI